MFSLDGCLDTGYCMADILEPNEINLLTSE